MAYKHSDLINYFEIEGNGLVGKFFEDLKDGTLKVKSENKISITNNLDTNKVGLYVITFNSPKQFETTGPGATQLRDEPRGSPPFPLSHRAVQHRDLVWWLECARTSSALS
jgi:hypothetical protein